jgi:hypothetical protein
MPSYSHHTLVFNSAHHWHTSTFLQPSGLRCPHQSKSLRHLSSSSPSSQLFKDSVATSSVLAIAFFSHPHHTLVLAIILHRCSAIDGIRLLLWVTTLLPVSCAKHLTGVSLSHFNQVKCLLRHASVRSTVSKVDVSILVASQRHSMRVTSMKASQHAPVCVRTRTVRESPGPKNWCWILRLPDAIHAYKRTESVPHVDHAYTSTIFFCPSDSILSTRSYEYFEGNFILLQHTASRSSSPLIIPFLVASTSSTASFWIQLFPPSLPLPFEASCWKEGWVDEDKLSFPLKNKRCCKLMNKGIIW